MSWNHDIKYSEWDMRNAAMQAHSEIGKGIPFNHGHFETWLKQYVSPSPQILKERAENQSQQPQFDLVKHLHRQKEFSLQTFGPDRRTGGVIQHIEKELKEVAQKPDDLSEWIDIVLLALDGAWRHGFTPEQIAEGLEAKQTKNENRQWPDWRTLPTDKAIEHAKSQSQQPQEGEGELRKCLDRFKWLQENWHRIMNQSEYGIIAIESIQNTIREVEQALSLPIQDKPQPNVPEGETFNMPFNTPGWGGPISQPMRSKEEWEYTTVKVRVKGLSYGKGIYWYGDKMGDIFEVKYPSPYGSYHVASGKFAGNGIQKTDCEIIDPEYAHQLSKPVDETKSISELKYDLDILIQWIRFRNHVDSLNGTMNLYVKEYRFEDATSVRDQKKVAEKTLQELEHDVLRIIREQQSNGSRTE